MTDTSPVSPQSATAPAETNIKRGEFSAIMTTEHEATADQRVLGVGNPIPLVFCKFHDGGGGAWVTPPAGRYGTTQDEKNGDRFAFGMVISDDEIGEVAQADIYKGAVGLAKLTNPKSEFRFGGMPETGFDYTLNFVTPGDPGTPGTPGYWTTKSGSKSDGWRVSPGQTWSTSVGNATSANVNFSSSGGISVRYQVYVNGGLQGDSGRYQVGASWSWSGSFGRGTLEVKVLGSGSYQPQFSASGNASISYQYQEWVNGTPGIPPTPDVTTNLPLFPGSGGSYEGMSCLAAAGKYAAGTEAGVFRQQVRCFVRKGVYVYNLLTGGRESSDLFPDLAYYLIDKSSRAGVQLVDRASFVAAAKFCKEQKFLFNGVVANNVNLRDYLSRVSPYFLLGFVQDQGQYKLKPQLPVTDNFGISSSSVPIAHVFSSADIVMGSYQKDYVDSAKREPFCALVTWRSQNEALFGVSKSTEVRYRDTAVDGPFEQYDLEEFCTDQEHAVTFAKFILASRKHSTHMISFSAISNIPSIGPLDFIQVDWGVETSLGSVAVKRETYQVNAITESADGSYSISANHFPLTADGQPLIARDTVGTDFDIK